MCSSNENSLRCSDSSQRTSHQLSRSAQSVLFCSCGADQSKLLSQCTEFLHLQCLAEVEFVTGYSFHRCSYMMGPRDRSTPARDITDLCKNSEICCDCWPNILCLCMFIVLYVGTVEPLLKDPLAKGRCIKYLST